MTISRFAFTALTSSLLVTGAVGCKKKTDAEQQAPPAAHLDEGTVFRDGFTEQTIPGQVHPDRPASDLREGCLGMIPREPSAEFTMDGDVPAKISVVADIDTVVAIVGPEGTFCNDDTDTMNPAVSRLWASGKYKVYVGSFEAQEAPFDYDLNFDHYDPRALPTGYELNHDAPRAKSASEPLEGATLTMLAPDVDARIAPIGLAPRAKATAYDFELPAGERMAATMLHADCMGNIDANHPDYIVNFQAGGPLNIVIDSDEDLTLVVRGPEDTLYCADDVLGHNPALRWVSAPEGAYAVYIGHKSTDGDATASGTLTVY